MSVSAPEEEPYSTMFGSLRHPIRRKILRMLSEKPRSFSEMLETSGISSSHLTYHLENLGQLVSKTDDGKYRLSTFGEAAVATMSRVEETPTKPKRPSSLPLKWKTLLVVLFIGILTLAGINYTQYQSLNRITGDYERLRAYYEAGGILTPNETLVLNNTMLPTSGGSMLTPNETLILNNTQLPSAGSMLTPNESLILNNTQFVN
jgi:DNA-binding transcriptional ArsR family regulator